MVRIVWSRVYLPQTLLLTRLPLSSYEVQVAAQHRQQRLGPVLMAMLESIAAHAGMRKVMLTVFRSNSSAMHFYIKNGYVIDGISPSQYQDAGGAGSSQGSADYEILSKAVGAWASGGT